MATHPMSVFISCPKTNYYSSSFLLFFIILVFNIYGIKVSTAASSGSLRSGLWAQWIGIGFFSTLEVLAYSFLVLYFIHFSCGLQSCVSYSGLFSICTCFRRNISDGAVKGKQLVFDQNSILLIYFIKYYVQSSTIKCASILHSSLIVVPNSANLLSQPRHSRLCSGPATAQSLSLSSSSCLLTPVRHAHLTPHSFTQHVNGSEEGPFCCVSIP
jgi:hypothetical protein